MHARNLVIEGILAIQAGENPRFVNEKLMAYVPPSKRPTEEEAAAAASGGGAGAADAEKAAA